MRLFLAALVVATLGLSALPALAEGVIVAHGGGSSYFHGKPPKLFKSYAYAFRKSGKRAKIVTVSSYETDENTELRDLLTSAGYRNVTHLNVKSPNAVAAIKAADLIYFDSGVQTRLMRKLNAHPKVLAAIRQAHASGTMIGGSSAGAAVMSDVMICCDKGGRAIEARGLGLLPGFVIDQHYTQRERQFRLRQIISKHPDKVGIGIDESVAVVFNGSKATVIGSPEKSTNAKEKLIFGCRKIKGIYTCTCGDLCPCSRTEIFTEGGIKRQCVKSLTAGPGVRQAVTIVRMVNGKLTETTIKRGKSFRLDKLRPS